MVLAEAMRRLTFAEVVSLGDVCAWWRKLRSEMFVFWLEGQEVGTPLGLFRGRPSQLRFLREHLSGEGVMIFEAGAYFLQCLLYRAYQLRVRWESIAL